MESDMFVKSAIIKQIKKEFTITNKSVNDRQEYYCQQCGYEASWKNELKKHVNAFHTEIRSKCEQCD